MRWGWRAVVALSALSAYLLRRFTPAAWPFDGFDGRLGQRIRHIPGGPQGV